MLAINIRIQRVYLPYCIKGGIRPPMSDHRAIEQCLSLGYGNVNLSIYIGKTSKTVLSQKNVYSTVQGPLKWNKRKIHYYWSRAFAQISQLVKIQIDPMGPIRSRPTQFFMGILTL